jgi:hypothetical protein
MIGRQAPFEAAEQASTCGFAPVPAGAISHVHALRDGQRGRQPKTGSVIVATGKKVTPDDTFLTAPGPPCESWKANGVIGPFRFQDSDADLSIMKSPSPGGVDHELHIMIGRLGGMGQLNLGSRTAL